MKQISIKTLLCIFAVFFCMTSLSTALAAETVTISGTVTDMSTYPNMVAIDDGGVVTEVYGIRFDYLERQYNIVIETGMTISVEAYENICNDGTIRLKATSLTVDDATIDLGRTGSGGRNSSIGRKNNGSSQGSGGSGQGSSNSGQGNSGSAQGSSGSGQGSSGSGQGGSGSGQGSSSSGQGGSGSGQGSSSSGQGGSGSGQGGSGGSGQGSCGSGQGNGGSGQGRN